MTDDSIIYHILFPYVHVMKDWRAGNGYPFISTITLIVTTILSAIYRPRISECTSVSPFSCASAYAFVSAREVRTVTRRWTKKRHCLIEMYMSMLNFMNWINSVSLGCSDGFRVLSSHGRAERRCGVAFVLNDDTETERNALPGSDLFMLCGSQVGSVPAFVMC